MRFLSLAIPLALSGLLIGAAPAMAAEPVASGMLYAGAAPGSEGWSEPRVVTECRGSISIYNTASPRFDLYLPDPASASGAAVLMLPGGGMRVLGTGEETDAEIAAFLAHGVAVMHLEYRTLQQPADSINRECHPLPPPNPDAPLMRFTSMEIVNGNANPATEDAQAAFRLLHDNAAQWHLDPERIGAIGTSAGGGVAFSALMAADATPDTGPDFLISIFGPSLVDIAAGEGSPPLFLVTEADHGPVTDGLIAAFSIWKAVGRKAELHVYEVPNFSMTVDLWGPRLFDWMVERGILEGPLEL